MANNPNVMANLRTPTSEEARAMQLKGAESRKLNNRMQKLLQKSIYGVLVSKMPVDASIRAAFEKFGQKVKDKESVMNVLNIRFLGQIAKDADVKNYCRLLQAAGMTFDQSDEAIGGSENPLNVNQNVNVTPERVKEISRILESEC